ncbi:hypothetical protein EDB81DRAFT_798667 [Dactylonectria macrodidyma]|uniref:Uncharacterized protein n=1 Tax=Dactylonectria macrodidyma TaxID=307937 RepID=A0A9P9EMW5_9HYPO|nr:hypothetical protein EDB81DRAFT_798667 [Dactylonectria macrodidyma]
MQFPVAQLIATSPDGSTCWTWPLCSLSLPSGSSGSGLVQHAAKYDLTMQSSLPTHYGRVIKGHPQVSSASLAQGGCVRRRCSWRWSGHPGRQSSCNAALCYTHDEPQPPTGSQDDLSVRLSGGWHGLSCPSWLPCRAPFWLLHETPFAPELTIQCTLLSPATYVWPVNQSSALISKQAILTQE